MTHKKMGHIRYDEKKRRAKVDWFSREITSPIAVEILIHEISKHLSLVRGDMLDVGCGNCPYYLMFEPLVQTYVGMDYVAGESEKLSLVGDAQAIPLKSDSFDTILCTEILEHVAEPQQALKEMFRVLRRSGILILTTPQRAPIHAAPHDYYRFTRYGLAYIAEKAGFKIRQISPRGGLFIFMICVANEALYSLAGGVNALLRRFCTRNFSVTRSYIFLLLRSLPQRIALQMDLLSNFILSRFIPLSLREKLLERKSISTGGYVMVCEKL